MRALFFALAALSLFAVFSAYTEDVSDSIEDLSSGYYGLDDATVAIHADCLRLCSLQFSKKKICQCACKGLPRRFFNRQDMCLRGCGCKNLSNVKCLNCYRDFYG